MSRRRTLLVVAVSTVALSLGVAALPLWHGPAPLPGPASGELSFSSHQGVFKLKPGLCRKAVTGKGAGVYDTSSPALAFGYFNDLDGGEWVEAQGPGVVGATRFDRQDCQAFEATVTIDAGRSSGHVEVVCDSKTSPGVFHVEGETTFTACP